MEAAIDFTSGVMGMISIILFSIVIFSNKLFSHRLKRRNRKRLCWTTVRYNQS